MGQMLDGGLTNPAVVSPGGQAQFFSGAPQAGMALARQAAQTAQPSTADVGPNGPTFDNPQPQQPKIAKPSFLQASSTGPGGTPNAMSPELSKAGKLAVLLTSGLKGALAGRAASEQAVLQSGGHRNGGAGLGFMAGYSQPFQEAQQRQQAQLGQAELQPIPLPGGVSVPAAIAPKFLSPYLGYQGKTDAARIIGQSRENVADTNSQTKVQTTQMQNQNKLDVVRLQTEIAKQKGVKFLPDTGPDGQMFYHVMNPYGEEIGQADVNAIPSLMQKYSDTTEYKDDGNGNIIALPKQTVSGPRLPNAQRPSSAPSAKGTGAPGSGGARVVAHGKPVGMVVGTDAEGHQVAGTPEEMRAAGVSQFTKLEGGEAAKVNTARQLVGPGGLFDLAAKDLAQFKPGELEALAPRWNEFLAGSVGTADPRYVRLRTHVNGLLGTAMMQAHVGARGGERIMEHFEDIANSGKMSKETLQTALDAEKQYVEEKAMRPKAGNAPIRTIRF